MSRLVLVSNRVAPPKGGSRAGGLAVALEAMLRERGGLWFGWSGEVTTKLRNRVKMTTVEGVTYAIVDLDAASRDAYYNGFANRSLWPLFHYRLDLSNFDRRYHEEYERVNTLFAKRLCPLVRPGDMIWVHDYHLIPLGEALRKMGCEASMGFFLHIPFPVPEVLTALPRHRRLIRSLLAYDLVGFQTPGDLNAFRSYVLQELKGRASGDNVLSAYGQTVEARVFPVGIDPDEFVSLANSPQARQQAKAMRDSLSGRHLIIGVDRLDYTKGLPERLEAFQRLLQDHPENRSHVSLLQIASPSRSDVPEYKDIRLRLETTAGHVNGKFAEVDWVPIRYINRYYSRRTLAGLFRTSRIGLVTPLRDGMNLVAKEYVAAQDEKDPGVLLLSRFAGAASQLGDALIVNPHDVAEVAAKLQQGLRMPLAERRQRWSAMMAEVRRSDVKSWRDDFLEALGAVRLAA